MLLIIKYLTTVYTSHSVNSECEDKGTTCQSFSSSQKNSMQNLRKCKIKIKMKSLFGEGKIGNLE